jgi:hypothetical protein
MLWYVNRLGSLTVTGAIAFWLFTSLSLYGQSPPSEIRNPHFVAYCTMGNLIVEYEDADVPEDLARRFDGYRVSVGVAFNEPGQIGCGYQPLVIKPKESAIHLSDKTLRRLTAPLCSSIQKWKFRPFIYDGQTAPVLGPVVVTIQNKRFMLDILDPPCQTNPRPVERK